MLLMIMMYGLVGFLQWHTLIPNFVKIVQPVQQFKSNDTKRTDKITILHQKTDFWGCNFLFHGAVVPGGPGTYSGWVISQTHRPVPDNIQHSKQTDIHATGGIRTHNPRKRAAADPRLRPFGNRDLQLDTTGYNIIFSLFVLCLCQKKRGL